MKPEHFQRLQGLRTGLTSTAARMDAERPRFDGLKTRHEDGTAPRAVSSFNLFQTPEHVAARMASMIAARVPENGRVLEPSAGLGRLYRAIRPALAATARVIMVDQSPECCRELRGLTLDNDGDRVHEADFLELMLGDLGGSFDAICMNPPFKQGADVRHIGHALDMLTPGGILVALCYDGVRQNAWLKPRATTWEQLPAGTFKEAGTDAAVILLTIEKPQGAT